MLDELIIVESNTAIMAFNYQIVYAPPLLSAVLFRLKYLAVTEP